MTKKQLIQLFEDRKVRTVWDDELQKWFFSIVDVCHVLTDSNDYQTARKYWKVLKGSDFGIPQDRERVFCVSILNPEGDFVFPRGWKLNKNTLDFIQTKEEIGQELWEKLVDPDENIDIYLGDNEQFKKFAGVQK